MAKTNTIQSVSFSGHESFPLRFAWLTKTVRGLVDDPALFASKDAVVRLGVGKNMVRAMRHWASRADMVRADTRSRRGGRYSPTRLGIMLFGPDGYDPYLEDPATVWLVHWQLCSRRNAPNYTDFNGSGVELMSPTTWFWLFNELLEPSFTQDTATTELMRYAERRGGKKLSKGTVERDVSCFIRTYTPAEPDKKISREDTYDSPLTDLGLLGRERETGRISFDRGIRPTLPSAVFTYALLDCWRREIPTSSTMSFQQVTYGPASPGQVFRLSENACVEYLEGLDDITNGSYSFDATSGLRQVVCHSKIDDPSKLLRRHFTANRGGASNAA
jgi:hypothetical protein